MSVKPAIFLDPDGTLFERGRAGARRVAPGAAEGLSTLARLECPLVVVSSAADGDDAREAHDAAQLAALFEASGAPLAERLHCPHPPGVYPPCQCRTPAPGLLHDAAARHGLDLRRSWMVGDILDDVEAGRRGGCRTILVNRGSETQWHRGSLRIPDAVVADFASAAQRICAALAPAHA